MSGYQAQYFAACAITAFLAGAAVVQAGDPARFGLSPVAIAWLGVVVAVLGTLNGLLPSVRRPPDSSYTAQATDPVRRDSRPPGSPVVDDSNDLERDAREVGRR